MTGSRHKSIKPNVCGMAGQLFCGATTVQNLLFYTAESFFGKTHASLAQQSISHGKMAQPKALTVAFAMTMSTFTSLGAAEKPRRVRRAAQKLK